MIEMLFNLQWQIAVLSCLWLIQIKSLSCRILFDSQPQKKASQSLVDTPFLMTYYNSHVKSWVWDIVRSTDYQNSIFQILQAGYLPNRSTAIWKPHFYSEFAY